MSRKTEQFVRKTGMFRTTPPSKCTSGVVTPRLGALNQKSQIAQIAAFSIRRLGLQGFLAIPVSMIECLSRNARIIAPSILVTPTTTVFPKVLRYQWEAHPDTEGSRAERNPLSSGLRGTQSTAIQIRDDLRKIEIGGLLQHFLRSSGF